MSGLPELDQHLCFALYKASRAMNGAYSEALGKLGLTYPQYLVLLTLWERDGERVSAVGQRLFLDSATLTPLLKRLEARGLLERRRSSTDERVVELFLTATGKRLKQPVTAAVAEVSRRTGLSAAAATTLGEALRELAKRLRSTRSQES